MGEDREARAPGKGFQRGKPRGPASAEPSRRPGREPPPGDLVLLGEFGRAHGLRGEVRLKSFTAEPGAIASYGPLIVGTGRAVTLKTVRPAPGGAPDLLIAQVEGVTTREGAEALNRVTLHLPRERLPPPEDEDEFLLADLVGLPVSTEAGDVIGTVVAVPNYGGGDLLEIAPARGGATALLPFTKAFVPVVDVAARRVVVAPPDDLFEPARPAPPDEGGDGHPTREAGHDDGQRETPAREAGADHASADHPEDDAGSPA